MNLTPENFFVQLGTDNELVFMKLKIKHNILIKLIWIVNFINYYTNLFLKFLIKCQINILD